MGRTNVVLNDDLVTKAKSLTGIKTIRQLIDYALHELVRHKRQKEILKLKGKINWQGNLDEMRESRQF
jgi:Arc/MetJ family transcription regulator